MNKKMKKIIATTVSAWGVFSQFPVGFCSPTSDEDKFESLSDDFLKSNVEDTSEDKVPAKTLALIEEETQHGKRPVKDLNAPKIPWKGPYGKMPAKNVFMGREGNSYGGKMPAKTMAMRREENPYGGKIPVTSFTAGREDKISSLKEFIDTYHFNPCPLNAKELKKIKSSMLETYIIYPKAKNESSSYKPQFFPDLRTEAGLKAVYFKENSFTFVNFKNILASNFGRACILPLEVDENSKCMPVEISNGKEYFFDGGFKVVIFGQGQNEGKTIRFDFTGLNYEEMEEYLKTAVTSRKVEQYNKAIKKIRSLKGLDNPYKMSLKTLENISTVIDILKIKLSLNFDVHKEENVIPPKACKGYSFIEEVAIPYGIKIINDSAFENCENLNFISIADSVERIEKSVFAGCRKLKFLNMPEYISYIGPETFKGCILLQEVRVPGTVKCIENSIFEGCKSLNKINLCYGIRKIGPSVFSGCESLECIEIPESVSYLGDKVFKNCKHLKKIILPYGVETLVENVFEGCEDLERIEIPNSVTFIGKGTFKGCTLLDNVAIPEGVNMISSGLFEDCKNLKNIYLSKNVTWIGENVFKGCGNLESIEIPQRVRIIRNGAFKDCEKLSRVILPKGIREIEGYAFSGCKSLECIEIPENIGCVSRHAFNECPNLKSIKYKGKMYDVNSFFKELNKRV